MREAGGSRANGDEENDMQCRRKIEAFNMLQARFKWIVACGKDIFAIAIPSGPHAILSAQYKVRGTQRVLFEVCSS